MLIIGVFLICVILSFALWIKLKSGSIHKVYKGISILLLLVSLGLLINQCIKKFSSNYSGYRNYSKNSSSTDQSRSGSDDVRSGGDDVRSGGDDVRSGGDDVRSGSDDVRSGSD